MCRGCVLNATLNVWPASDLAKGTADMPKIRILRLYLDRLLTQERYGVVSLPRESRPAHGSTRAAVARGQFYVCYTRKAGAGQVRGRRELT